MPTPSLCRCLMIAFAVVGTPFLVRGGHAPCLVEPQLAGTTSFDDFGRSIYVSNGLAVVADSFPNDGKVHLFNVDNPDEPQFLNTISTTARAFDAWIDGSTLYVACGWSGLDIIDISDPMSPSPVTNFRPIIDEDKTVGLSAFALWLDGDRMHVANGWGEPVFVIDVSNPSNPALITIPQPEGYNTVFAPRRMIFRNGIAYLVSGYKHFQAIDVSNPADPVSLYSSSLEGRQHAMLSLALTDTHAFATRDVDIGSGFTAARLFVFDISDPQNIAAHGAIADLGNSTQGIVVSGDSLFEFKGGSDTTLHYDISDPLEPVSVSSFPSMDGLYRGFILQDFLFAIAPDEFRVYTDFDCMPSCPADVTGDNQINLADLNLVLANFGQTTSDGDTNEDGEVDLEDLNAVLASFGTVCP